MQEVRRLVGGGEVLPLERVIQVITEQQPGRALEVELERKSGAYLYEVEWLDTQGQVWEYLLDAKSGRVIARERD